MRTTAGIPGSCRPRAELAGFGRRLRLADVVLEDGMAIGRRAPGDGPALDQAFQEHQVAPSVQQPVQDTALTTEPMASSTASSRTNGVASVLQPGVMAAVQLHQHPRLGHPLAAETVLRRVPTAGTANARLGPNAPHRGSAEVDALPLTQQLGEVGVVGALVALRRQFHDGGCRESQGWRCEDSGRGRPPTSGGRDAGSLPAARRPGQRDTWYSRTEFCTDSRACSCWFNVTSFIRSDILADPCRCPG